MSKFSDLVLDKRESCLENLYSLLKCKQRNEFPDFKKTVLALHDFTTYGNLWVSLLRNSSLWIGKYGKEKWIEICKQCETKMGHHWTKTNSAALANHLDNQYVWVPNDSENIDDESFFDHIPIVAGSGILNNAVEYSPIFNNNNELSVWHEQEWDEYHSFIIKSKSKMFLENIASNMKIRKCLFNFTSASSVLNLIIWSKNMQENDFFLSYGMKKFGIVKHPWRENTFVIPETFFGALPWFYGSLRYSMHYSSHSLSNVDHIMICDLIYLEEKLHRDLTDGRLKHYFSCQLGLPDQCC